MSSTVLKIMSWNLWDYEKAPSERHAMQREFLREAAPDVLCVQELWDDSPGHQALGGKLDDFAAALGMCGRAAEARRTHCHMAVLWRPDIAELARWRSYELHLWHGLGVATLTVGSVALRVAVTHLGPWDPEHRLSEARTVAAQLARSDLPTIVAADWNCVPEDPRYDPEPDLSSLHPEKVLHHIVWNQDSPVVDRRPAQLLHMAGLVDAARHLGVPWQPTGGHRAGDIPRRLDGFRVSEWALRALVGYRVIDTEWAMTLSDHLPIELTLDTARFSQPIDAGHAIPPRPARP
jgi:endonuclease/exonuclease/phosphatase family metal-dependent hydrolase